MFSSQSRLESFLQIITMTGAIFVTLCRPKDAAPVVLELHGDPVEIQRRIILNLGFKIDTEEVVFQQITAERRARAAA